jgi:hypothetical protein
MAGKLSKGKIRKTLAELGFKGEISDKGIRSATNEAQKIINRAKVKLLDGDAIGAYERARNKAMDMAKKGGPNSPKASEISKALPPPAELSRMNQAAMESKLTEAMTRRKASAKTETKAQTKAKEFKGFEGKFDSNKMDPREYGAPTRDAEGVLRNYKGGTKKPKKMNMGGQMQNRFSKKDYRKGGLFR